MTEEQYLKKGLANIGPFVDRMKEIFPDQIELEPDFIKTLNELSNQPGRIKPSKTR